MRDWTQNGDLENVEDQINQLRARSRQLIRQLFDQDDKVDSEVRAKTARIVADRMRATLLHLGALRAPGSNNERAAARAR